MDLWLPARRCRRVPPVFIWSFVLRELAPWFAYICGSPSPVAAEIPPIHVFIGRLRRVQFGNEWCVMTRLSASEFPLWRRPFVSERLRLSLRFWKQSITNPGCQRANVFLNTWKLRSSVRFSKAARLKIEKRRTFTIPLSICQLLCNVMCLKNKMELNRTTCAPPAAPCK